MNRKLSKLVAAVFLCYFCFSLFLNLNFDSMIPSLSLRSKRQVAKDSNVTKGSNVTKVSTNQSDVEVFTINGTTTSGSVTSPGTDTAMNDTSTVLTTNVSIISTTTTVVSTVTVMTTIKTTTVTTTVPLTEVTTMAEDGQGVKTMAGDGQGKWVKCFTRGKRNRIIKAYCWSPPLTEATTEMAPSEETSIVPV